MIIFFGVAHAQNKLNGKWYKVGTNWQVYINIIESEDGQILKEYMQIADNQNLISTKPIFKQWMGSSFTKTVYMGRVYNTKLKIIDDKTILYGEELYQRYDLPRDFLKGN